MASRSEWLIEAGIFDSLLKQGMTRFSLLRPGAAGVRLETFLSANLLKCPLCGSDFLSKPKSLFCKQGHSFPYTENVIDFSSAEEIDHVQQRSTHSFGIEWTKYYANLGWNSEELQREKDMFLAFTRALPSFFSNKVVVDAGCGNGRYINVLNHISFPPPRLIIGVDLSDSIFVAARNCSIFNNVLFMKVNLNLLPKILRQSADYVYSLGVLHHTPNAKESFDNLAKCVRPSGYMSLYLYGKGNPILFRINSFLRNRFFQKWPHELVYCLCVSVSIPCQIFRIRFVGPLMLDWINRFIFISPDVHNMYDAYTAGYTSFHDRKEVEEWYRMNGFDCVVESQLNHTALFCIGRKIHE